VQRGILQRGIQRPPSAIDLTRDGESGTEQFAEQARSMLMTGTPTPQETHS